MASIWTIRRSTADRKLTGLCGGIAAHWGIDPLLVRIGGVVLAVSGGIGLVLYLAGWLFIPEQGTDRSKLEELIGPRMHKVPRGAWIVIVVVACLIATGILGSLLPFGLGPALILAGIWYFGYYRSRGSRPSSQPSPPEPNHQAPPTVGPAPHGTAPYGTPPDSPFAQAAEAWRRRVAEASTGTEESAAAPPVDRQPPAAQPPAQPPYTWTAPNAPNAPRAAEPSGPVGPPNPATGTEFTQPPWAAARAEEDRRARADYFSNPDPIGLYRPEPAVPVPVAPPRPGDRPSARRLRLVGLVALGLVLAGLGTADALGAPITATIYVGVALLVVGLTLVAGTWLGRARGVLPIGILLAIALACVTAAGQADQVRDLARDTRVYNSAAELPTEPITKDFGGLELDLSQVELKRDTTLTANVEFGALRVKVPDDVNLNVRYRIDNGSARVLDRREQSGSDLGDILQIESRPDAPTLTLHLTIDQGTLEVTR
ncbi:PspC domain-containing protein [Microlunatus speluncae]|uniref:PspC domain-containing protein n=1 Tax=Microlunatus speluncae TaxID=2594267 RepID=UPI0013758E86|nr:PspC domain-containing protein [Microlunatus speluncae]